MWWIIGGIVILFLLFLDRDGDCLSSLFLLLFELGVLGLVIAILIKITQFFLGLL